MKFMKLGTRPDTFFTIEATRSVSSEVSTDIKIKVENSLYLLHKFPLLSKCSRLQSLCSKQKDSSEETVIELPDIPGGAEAFEVCTKFCYGITVTLSALNFVPVYCAANYLQMHEDVDRGNLVSKLDVFLKSCILRRWKDALTTLQSTVPYSPLCDGVTSRCIDALASKIVAHPSRVEWGNSNKGWWAEDVSELGVEFFWRIMLAVKSAGTVSSRIVGEAIRIYGFRWLPNLSRDTHQSKPSSDSSSSVGITKKHRVLLEKIISLLPSEKGALPCTFLLKLLKAANILDASRPSKLELARRIGVQLEEADVSDLLIPSLSYADDTLYDVDIVTNILEEFMVQGQSPPTSPHRPKNVERRRRSRSAENVEFEGRESSSRRSSSVTTHGSKLRVAKIIDCYLQEIARDENLPLEKVIALAEAVPDFARPDHDDLYRVIDTYLRAHPDLDKSGRKKLCRILNCKKLSMEACMHAAQNELLPLRVVVQVLFFEQARAAATGAQVTELPHNIRALLGSRGGTPLDRDWSLKYPESSNLATTLRMKLAQGDDNDIDDDHVLIRSSSSRFKALCSIPTKPKRILSKLWSMNRSVREGH